VRALSLRPSVTLLPGRGASRFLSTAIPCGKQGSPRSLSEGLRSLPCGLPGSAGEAEDWRPYGEISQRLLSAGPAVRPCVSGRTAAAGDRRRRTTLLVDFSNSWTTPGRGRSVRSRGKTPKQPTARFYSGRFSSEEWPKGPLEDAEHQSGQGRKVNSCDFLLHSPGT